MENVTVRKVDLLEALKANRRDHQAIFDEALEGYRDAVLQQLTQHLDEVQKGKVKQVLINLPMPENHTKDYDRAIRMVEMSVHDEIEVDEHSFRQYVMDDWAWKRQFLASNAGYSATATTLLEG